MAVIAGKRQKVPENEKYIMDMEVMIHNQTKNILRLQALLDLEIKLVFA